MRYLLFFAALQIILESLPVSSSGHWKLMKLFFFKYYCIDVESLIPGYFYYFIHGPTIFIIIYFFLKHKKSIISRWFDTSDAFCVFISRIVLVELITVLMYVLFSFTGSTWFPLCIGFMCSALILISLKFVPPGKNILSMDKALIIGFAQGISLLPGVSRLATVYTVSRWLGIEPVKAFDFSLFIQLPLVIAAFCKSLWRLSKWGEIGTFLNVPFLLVVIGASMIAYRLLVWVSLLVQEKKMWLFSWYLLVPASLCIMLMY